MQLRDRLHDLIFENDDSGTDQAAHDMGYGDLENYTPPAFSRGPGVPDKATPRIFQAVSQGGSLFSSLKPDTNSDAPLFYPCAESTSPDELPAAMEESLTAHIDPDMGWMNDALFDNLMGRLCPKDPVQGKGNPPQQFSGCEVQAKKGSEWDSLTQSADGAQYPVFAIDRSRKVIVWNTAMEQLTGIPRKEMIGKGDHAYALPFFGSPRQMLIDYIIIPPEIAKILDPVPALQDGETFVGEMEEAQIHGQPVHMWSRASRIYNADGKVTAAVQSVGIAMKVQPAASERDGAIGRKQAGLYSAFEKLGATQEELLRNYRDLTQAQQQLIESEQKFRTQQAFLKSVISDAREGIIAYDRELRYILWNQFMENITGMPATEVLGRGAGEMFPVLKLAGADHLLERAIAGETVESSDFSLIIPKSGKQVWVKVIYSPLKDSDGVIFGVIGIVQDTTARKVMEYALQTTIVQLVESESKYRNVFNAKNDPHLLVEPRSRRILDLNDAAAEVYGYSREELLEMSLPDLYAEPEVTGQESPLPVSQVWTGHHRKKDGTLFPVDVSSSYAEVKGDSVLILSVRDLSSVQRIADSLRLANVKLNLLMGITRHDVLNNLTAVMGYNSLMKKDISDPAIIDMLDKMETALGSMRHQIEFTREYDELGVKTPRWQNIHEIASRSYSQFMNTVAFSCDTGDLEIYADPMLERVFYNLFDNTFRYGHGLSRIRIYCEQKDSDLLLFFEDDGPGVSDEDKERIFIRGYGRHTGLGLFLAREILAITRIEIHENGDYSKGARFEFRIPKGSYHFGKSPIQGSPAEQETAQVQKDPFHGNSAAVFGSPAEKNEVPVSGFHQPKTPPRSGFPVQQDETSLPFFLNKLREQPPQKKIQG